MAARRPSSAGPGRGTPLTVDAVPWYRTEVMYAIIEAGGKQYRVAEGDVIRCDLVASEVGSDVTFDRVMLAGSGDAVKVGSPILDGASRQRYGAAPRQGQKDPRLPL